ncbi:hypothetical protein CLOP_g5046 [Closterium sp. NIES-67]|nr:hypothetical protein CLOP_g5046 [Closterium sp. NIES-67]
MADPRLAGAGAGGGAAYSVPWTLGPCASPPSLLPAGWTAFLFPFSLLPTFYAFTAIQLVLSAAVQAVFEVLGFNLGYSKFASAAKWKTAQVPSLLAFLLFYLPSALLAALFLSAALGLSPARTLLYATHMVPATPIPLPPTTATWTTAPPAAAADTASGVGGVEGAGIGKLGLEGSMGAWQLVAAATSSEQWRLVLVCAACFVHYAKRCLETLFLHRYSGSTALPAVVFVTLGYCDLSYALLSAQWITAAALSSPAAAAAAGSAAAAAASLNAASAGASAPCSLAPAANLMPLGLLLFLIGVAGNFYHHWILSRLRSHGSHEYRVPHGGLFHWVTCPHYLFECINFLGVALMSQTAIGVAEFLFTLLYLCGRSIATKRWYRKKMDDYPASRWAIIPFVL